MARVSTYLNFARSTEDAFSFYRSVLGTEFSGPIMRFRDVPEQPGQPPLAAADNDLVMHVELPILAGHVLMGTDAPESMGFTLTPGNTITINLEPDTRAQADKLFAALGAGGKVSVRRLRDGRSRTARTSHRRSPRRCCGGSTTRR